MCRHGASVHTSSGQLQQPRFTSSLLSVRTVFEISNAVVVEDLQGIFDFFRKQTEVQDSSTERGNKGSLDEEAAEVKGEGVPPQEL